MKMKPTESEIGKRMRERRKDLRLSQDMLGLKAFPHYNPKSVQTKIKRIEAGLQRPKGHELITIANVLGMTTEELTAGTGLLMTNELDLTISGKLLELYPGTRRLFEMLNMSLEMDRPILTKDILDNIGSEMFSLPVKKDKKISSER